MFRNYFLIAVRNLAKYKTHAFINISGLAVGMASSLLIMLYVAHEFSYDKFHRNASNIYRMLGKMKYGGVDVQAIAMSAAFGPKIKESNADVQNYVRTRLPGRIVVRTDEQHTFFESGFLFADTSFFSVFSFPLIRGDRTALARPNTVVLTEETALKYFGAADPIGKTITYNREHIFEVVGIASNPPSNSSLTFGFVASFSSLETIAEEKAQYVHGLASLGAFPTYLLVQD